MSPQSTPKFENRLYGGLRWVSVKAGLWTGLTPVCCISLSTGSVDSQKHLDYDTLSLRLTLSLPKQQYLCLLIQLTYCTNSHSVLNLQVASSSGEHSWKWSSFVASSVQNPVQISVHSPVHEFSPESRVQLLHLSLYGNTRDTHWCRSFLAQPLPFQDMVWEQDESNSPIPVPARGIKC